MAPPDPHCTVPLPSIVEDAVDAGGRPGSPTRSPRLPSVDMLRRFAGRVLRRRARALRIRFGMAVQAGAVILTYHRIADADSDPLLLSVSPSRFAEHLDVIRRRCRPVSLQDLVQRLIRREAVSGMIAITFDDGYADNLQHGKPLLERYEIPATVFVASAGVGRVTEFPWDELERLLLRPGTLPQSLPLKIGHKRYSWDLGMHAHYDLAAYERHRRWNVQSGSPPTSRHRLYLEIGALIRPLDAQDREAVLDDLRRWAGVRPAGRQSRRTLTANELLSLADGSLVDIGSHTATHPLLCVRSLSQQQSEIKGSKAFLEDLLGREIKHFAYPYGSLRAFDARTIRVVKDAGFSCACSTVREVVTQSTDPYQLPRFTARNWDGDEFARHMREWEQS